MISRPQASPARKHIATSLATTTLAGSASGTVVFSALAMSAIIRERERERSLCSEDAKESLEDRERERADDKRGEIAQS